ncbi:MAG: HU family DNA-binding protein [Candidatus Caenarcaniphilales bacterium]|nr:HU family DNA-binding protein [Candidatus Caenarcaniphilales bacterium]
MNKTELIDQIANQTQLEKTKVAKVVNSLLDNVSEALSNHESVTLIGFGTFKVRRRKAKKGVNPQTGKTMTIAAKDVPAVSFGEILKKSVAKKKKLKKFVSATAKKKVSSSSKAKSSSKKVVKKASPKKPAKKSSKKK